MSRSGLLALLVAAAVTLLVAIGLIRLVTPEEPLPPPAPTTVVEAELGTGAGETVTVEAPASAVEALEEGAGELGADEGGLRDDADAPAKAKAQAKAQADRIAAGPDALPEGAGEGATENLPAGCRARYVQNQSDRGGTKPRVITVHYPVAANRPGRSDMDALAVWLNNPAAMVSYHRTYDWEGHCMANVPLARKAWAAVAFNRIGIHYSMMGRGRVDGKFAPPAALRKFAADIARTAKAYGIPIQRAKVSGGTVTRPGILAHGDLGAAGGGHVDITPWSIDAVIAEVKRQAGGSSSSSPPKYAEARFNLKALTAEERRQSKRLLAERRIADRRGGWSKVSAGHLAAAVKAKRWLNVRKAWLGARLSSKANRAERFRVIRAVVAT